VVCAGRLRRAVTMGPSRGLPTRVDFRNPFSAVVTSPCDPYASTLEGAVMGYLVSGGLR
jgi:hypothetical protein